MKNIKPMPIYYVDALWLFYAQKGQGKRPLFLGWLLGPSTKLPKIKQKSYVFLLFSFIVYFLAIGLVGLACWLLLGERWKEFWQKVTFSGFFVICL